MVSTSSFSFSFSSSSSSSSSRRRDLGLLLGLAGLLLVLAALRPLSLPDEGRYADVSRWMAVGGDWLVPRLNGLPFFHKPPMLHWLQAALFEVFGVGPWVARLVPAAHAMLMVVVLYLVTREVWGQARARRAALMLGTSFAFLGGGQYVNHDMLVATWISVALWCFGLFFVREKPSPWLARAGFVACAFAVLSKGLIGVVLPGLVLLPWLAVTGRWRKLLQLPWITGMALLLAIALPWFLMVQARFPGFYDYFVIGQHFARYAQAGFNNVQPGWFFVVVLPLLLPWALFALVAAGQALARRAVVRPSVDPWTALLWIWVLVITLFFSVPRSKLVGYILPAVPPLAALSAVGWERLMAGRRHERALFAGGCALLLLLSVGLDLGAAYTTRKRHWSGDVAAVLAREAGRSDTVYVAGGFPYDLALLADLPRPPVMVADWPQVRRTAGDNWQRELFEGADFDPQAAHLLQDGAALDAARSRAGSWLVLSAKDDPAVARGWQLVLRGAAWNLYRSVPR